MIKEDKIKGTENYLKKLRDATQDYLNEVKTNNFRVWC